MNVDHVSNDSIPVPTDGRDKLAMIFERQLELMHKYEDIEAANGLLQTPDIPVDIHDKFGQARLKDMSWRVTEELTEAAEALLEHGDVPNHFLEEVSDALHFLVEFTILCGDTVWASSPGEDRLDNLFSSVECMRGSHITNEDLLRKVYFVIHNLGLACNCLKNKPWKQTQQLTDRVKFAGKVRDAWIAFISMALSAGFTADTLYAMYFKKSEVNKFRQRSKY
jgi:hypothetical protein